MSIENSKLMNLADGKVLYDDLRGRIDENYSDLKNAITSLTDLEKTCYFDETVSGTGSKEIAVNIPAGAYYLHIDEITTDDTDYDNSTFVIKNSSGNIITKNYTRNHEINEIVYLSSDATALQFYASRYAAQSAGDEFEFKGLSITKDYALKSFADNTEDEIELIERDYYLYKLMSNSSATANYRLRGDGLRVSDSNYDIKFFEVTPGSEIKVISDDKFVFQSGKTVPSSGVNSYMKSKIYEKGKHLLLVPEGATYLAVSALKNGISTVYSVATEANALHDDIADLSIVNTGLSRVRKNLIEKDKCVKGSLNTSGEFIAGNEYVTEYIPVSVDNVYRRANIQTWVYYYDSDKEFLYRKEQPLSVITNSETAYIRMRISASNLETARFEYAQNWNKNDINGYIYGAASSVGNEIIDKTYSSYAESNGEQYKASGNLFDYVNDLYFNGSKVNSNGFEYSVNDSDVPTGTNGYIATFTYYPVQYGRVLLCNYDLWGGVFYDSSKQSVATFNAIDAGIGAVVPQGAAFVRVNVKATTTTPTPAGKIGNMSEMKKFMLYTVDGSQDRLPTRKTVSPKYQLDGAYVSANYLDKVVPSMESSEFLSAMKCMTIREINKRDHAYRFGNFNMWVPVGQKGWENTRKMLLDYGVDFCGFEEVNTSNNDLLSEFMKSWQFPFGFNTNFTDGENVIDKSFVSRYEILSSTKFWTQSTGTAVSGLNCKIQLPRYMDIYNPSRVLSVYLVHLPITTDANKVSTANEILALIAEDTSDFVMIFGDTNDFASTEEGKLYWRTFEAAGFRPVIPIETKTVTQDTLQIDTDDPSKNWRHHSIDQFCVSSNIDLVSYGVVNTKDEYYRDDVHGPATDNQPALSDHDFVYCDLRFKYDQPRDSLPSDDET